MAVAVSETGIRTQCFGIRTWDNDSMKCASIIVLKLIRNSIKGKNKIKSFKFYFFCACFRYYQYIVAFYIKSALLQLGYPIWVKGKLKIEFSICWHIKHYKILVKVTHKRMSPINRTHIPAEAYGTHKYCWLEEVNFIYFQFWSSLSSLLENRFGHMYGADGQETSHCYMPVRELGSTSFSVIPVTPPSFPSSLHHHHLFILRTVHYCLSSSLRLSSFVLFFVTDLFCPCHVPSIISRFCGCTILL